MPIAKRLSTPEHLCGQEAGGRRPSAVCSHTRRTESAGGACALLRRPAGATSASRRLWAPPCCWIERVSVRYARFVMTRAASGAACVHRYTDRHTLRHGINTDRYTTGIRALRWRCAGGGPWPLPIPAHHASGNRLRGPECARADLRPAQPAASPRSVANRISPASGTVRFRFSTAITIKIAAALRRFRASTVFMEASAKGVGAVRLVGGRSDHAS